MEKCSKNTLFNLSIFLKTLKLVIDVSPRYCTTHYRLKQLQAMFLAPGNARAVGMWCEIVIAHKTTIEQYFAPLV